MQGKLKEIERNFPASVSVIVEPFKPTLYQVGFKVSFRGLGRFRGLGLVQSRCLGIKLKAWA